MTGNFLAALGGGATGTGGAPSRLPAGDAGIPF
jgi:hypothetical protein